MLLVIRVLSFRCDEAGCDGVSNQYIPHPDQRPSAIAWSRKQAEADGWTFELIRRDVRNPKSDPNQWARCPECSRRRPATAPEPAGGAS